MRCFLLSIGLLGVVIPSLPADESASRKVFFFDLWKLDAWNNLELEAGQLEWIEDCEYRDPAFPDRGVYFPSAWIDKETGEWRLVYSVKWSPLTLMAARSTDGIHWEPLPVPDAVPGEGEEKLAPNHLLTVPSGSGSGIYHDPRNTDGYPFRIFGRQHGTPVYERALTDPEHRWHEVAKSEGEKRYIGQGITLVSKDGLHWEVKTDGHWDWNAGDWFPEPPVFAFWNAKTGRHVMAARPGWGDRRQCLRTTGDFRHWSDPELQFQPDPLDTAGPIGMYGLPVHPVGNGAGFVGLLWIFHNSSSKPVNSFNQFFGTMDAQLVYSYDGVRFIRGPRQPFLERNPFPKPGSVQIRPCSIVETGDRVYIFSEGHRGAHGRERSQQKNSDESLGALMLHSLRKDGWMALGSSGDWAEFQTKPFALRSPGIRINAAAPYGEVEFQLTSEDSKPIEGYRFEDCVPLRGEDTLNHQLAWKNANISTLLNRPLRLEVRFRQAKIYSLDMHHHFLDAHDKWLLEDGKELPEDPRFDF